jgi:hypothetical protein
MALRAVRWCQKCGGCSRGGKSLDKNVFWERKGVRQAMNLGVIYGGARKSDFNLGLGKQLRGRPFRDQQVAAPLKLIAWWHGGGGVVAFRDQQVAAPLKREKWAVGGGR